MARFTLNDLLVQESLKKISEINEKLPDLPMVTVGGMAVQSYTIDPELYRPTNDADLMTRRPVAYSEFREAIGNELSGHIKTLGYETAISRPRRCFQVSAYDGDQFFFIHLSKFSEAYLKRNGSWKDREIKNAKERYMAGLGGRPLLVHRIEDIFANKARRLGTLNRTGFIAGSEVDEWHQFLEEDFAGLGSVDLKRKLSDTVMLREKLITLTPEYFSENYEILNKYKVKKDLYDLSVLSRTIIEGKEPLDPIYLRSALSTVPSIK